jgi:hypothetical protein
MPERRMSGDAGPGENGKLRREAPHLGRVRGDVAAHAEIGRMPERQQADEADEQVEGRGEQREAQHLHQEHGVEQERARRDQHQHRREGDLLRGGHADAGGDGGRHLGCGHHALPNRPAGLSSSTIAMMTKITVFEASG